MTNSAVSFDEDLARNFGLVPEAQNGPEKDGHERDDRYALL
jgi:hypothetical protein